jgi:cell division protein FtsB
MDSEGRMNIDLQGKFHSLLTNYGRHVLVVFVAILMVHDVFGTHGFIAMHRKQQEIAKVKSEIDRLNKENTGFEQDVRDLKSDPQTIGKIAREEMNLSKPGEVIIRLPAQAVPVSAAAKP